MLRLEHDDAVSVSFRDLRYLYTDRAPISWSRVIKSDDWLIRENDTCCCCQVQARRRTVHSWQRWWSWSDSTTLYNTKEWYQGGRSYVENILLLRVPTWVILLRWWIELNTSIYEFRPPKNSSASGICLQHSTELTNTTWHRSAYIILPKSQQRIMSFVWVSLVVFVSMLREAHDLLLQTRCSPSNMVYPPTCPYRAFPQAHFSSIHP